jgi:hypothetical protein
MLDALTRPLVLVDEASKAARPAPALSLGLVRLAFYENTHFEGTPLRLPAHGLRPRDPCLRVGKQQGSFWDFDGALRTELKLRPNGGLAALGVGSGEAPSSCKQSGSLTGDGAFADCVGGGPLPRCRVSLSLRGEGLSRLRRGMYCSGAERLLRWPAPPRNDERDA